MAVVDRVEAGTREELAGLSIATVRTHQAILFFTTGELPLASAIWQAIFQHVHEGAGFIGVHSAISSSSVLKRGMAILAWCNLV